MYPLELCPFSWGMFVQAIFVQKKKCILRIPYFVFLVQTDSLWKVSFSFYYYYSYFLHEIRNPLNQMFRFEHPH